MPLEILNRNLFPDDNDSHLPRPGSKSQDNLVKEDEEVSADNYFDEMKKVGFDAVFDELVKNSINILEVVKSSRDLSMLDLGTGMGIVPLFFLKEDIQLNDLTLSDINPNQIENAKNRIQNDSNFHKIKSLNSLAVDLLEQPLEQYISTNYDLITSSNTFVHFPKEYQAKLIADIRKILNPKGVFALVAHVKPLMKDWKKQLVNRSLSGLDENADPTYVEKVRAHVENYHTYPNLYDLYNWFEKANYSFFECVYRQSCAAIFIGIK